MERVARELHAGVAVAVERVAAVARVARRVGAAPAEEAHAGRHGEGDRHAVVVQAVVLLVRVHPDHGEDDGQDGEGRQHDAEHDLADAPAVHLDAGAAELPDAVGGIAWLGRCRPRSGGGRHRDRAIVVAAPRGRPARPGPRERACTGAR